ncbi:unnamed protein product [Orchesella dallaii]|uniref:Uncharacterized protein n=1 Tax=Orchesella dallaii TaxID=48710 RepID=A0ABP1R4Y6_9HEXA
MMRRSRRSCNNGNGGESGGFTPRVIPTLDKPGRVTNQLVYMKEKVVEGLLEHADAWPFSKPVDPVKLNLADYDLIIRHPMDLGTVKKRLENRFYFSASECMEDLQKVFQNCYDYNSPEQEVFLMAKTLEIHMNSLLGGMPKEEAEVKLMETEQVHDPEDAKVRVEKPMTFVEKMCLYQNIKKLTSDELQGVVKIIGQEPRSLTELVPDKEIEIELDALSISTLRELETYVGSCRNEKLKRPFYKVVEPKAVIKAELEQKRDHFVKKLKKINEQLKKLDEA